MPQSIQTENSLNCLLVNPDQILAAELTTTISEQGITVTTITENDIKTAKSTNSDYLVWFLKSSSVTVDDIAEWIEGHESALTRILLVAPQDITQSNSEIKDRCIKLKDKLSIDKNRDIRAIIHEGVWSPTNTATPNSPNVIGGSLKEGILPEFQLTELNPCNSSQVAASIMRVWFDRGHRGQTITIKGESVSWESIEQQLLEKYPQLTRQPMKSGWGTKSSVDGEVIVLKSSNPTEFIDHLSSQVSIPTSPELSLVKGEKSGEDGQSELFSKINTAPELPKEPELPRARFQAVVVEEESRGEARLARMPEPPKTFILPSQNQKPSRLPRIISGVIAIFALLLMIPAGGVMFYLFQAKAATPNLELSELTQRSVNLTTIETTAKQLNLYPLIKSRTVQAKEQLLKTTATKAMSQAVKYMLTATEGDPYAAFQAARHTLDDLYLLQSTEKTTTDRQWTIQTRRAIDLIPELIPADKKITLMMLLQNNLELRPSGGFVGSIALLTFDHGKLLSYDTRDIYDLDSNLKGVVNPPAELRTYLGESSWYFRDANWYPDFLDTATTANWFLEKEWGSRADVVVGINLNTLKELVAGIKSITLPDGQIIGPDNILVTAFNYQDAPTGKPGDKKQEFVSLFIKPLLDQITTADPQKAINLITAFGKAAAEGEVTVAVNDTVAVSSLVEAGWSGKISTLDCPSSQPSPCQGDFLYVNEANVGINKANFYLKRSINHTLSLTDVTVSHQHEITYDNQSPNDTWPAGSYKAYTRVIVPPTATDITIAINGSQLKAADYTNTSTAGYQQVGFFLETKPQAKNTLTVNYQLPLSPNFKGYAFTLQKQPGASADPVKLTITPTTGRNFQTKNTLSGGVFDKSILTTIEMAQ